MNFNKIVYTWNSYVRIEGRTVSFQHLVSERSVRTVSCRFFPGRYNYV